MKTLQLTGCYVAAFTAGFFISAVFTTLLHVPLIFAFTGAFLVLLRLLAVTGNARVIWYDYFIYGFASLAMCGFLWALSF